MTDAAQNSSESKQTAARARRRLRLMSAAVVGSAVGLFSALAILVLLNRNTSPELTRSAFDAAQKRWEATAPDDYDIEVAVTGLRAATYRVEVRDGYAKAATIDGRPLKNSRTFGTWSVPGMFSTMESDVQHVERRAAGTADPRSARLTLYATFDPKRGIPQKYHRIEWGEGGSDLEVTWEVLSFRER